MNIRAAGILLLAALLPSAQGQDIWRHVTEHGDLRYADRPLAGAAPVALPEPSGWTGSMARAPAPEAENTPPPDSAHVRLPSLELLRPTERETVRGSGGGLKVMLGGDFEKQSGHRLLLELDGAEAEWMGEPPEVVLNNVWRGEHRLRARLLDEQGRERASSREVVFYKREPSLAEAPSDPR
ncbi:MAG: hypothetical protein OXC70_01395 [Gammaproteobacteria bacterium]|nr:hypothetical protein [Gammaproteobacteria bacterium]